MAQTKALEIASQLATYIGTTLTSQNYITDNTDVQTALGELDAAIKTNEDDIAGLTLDSLGDVTITSAATGEILRHDGTAFINADLTGSIVDETFSSTNYLDSATNVHDALEALDTAIASNTGTAASHEQIVLGASPATFTLGTSGRTAENILVARNGVTLAPGASNDYTLSGTTVTFNGSLTPAPAQNDVMDVRYLPL